MEDKEIVDLYWVRDEKAIKETSLKYGRLLAYIANNILKNREDVEECISDTYLAVWNAIPDKRPNRLGVFVGRIARNLTLKKYEYISAAKRNPSCVTSFEELKDCISGEEGVYTEIENRRIESAINYFLLQQSEVKRSIFIRRYWYFDSIENICGITGFSRSKVKSILFEIRRKLKEYLESESIEI